MGSIIPEDGNNFKKRDFKLRIITMADMHTPKKYILKTVRVLRNEGARSLGVKSLKKIAAKLEKQDIHQPARVGFDSIVDRQDVMRADLSKLVKTSIQEKVKGSQGN